MQYDCPELSRERIDIAIAQRREHFAGAFELVYRRYREKGFVHGNPGGILYRREFGHSESRTMVAVSPCEGVIGTLTIVGDGPGTQLHVERLFPETVALLRARRRKFVEVTALATEALKNVPKASVFFALGRLMFQHVCWRGCDDVILAIHPRHGKVYERCFHAFPVGEMRLHATYGNQPAICYRLDIQRTLQSLDPVGYAYFVENRIPEVELARPGMSAADHLYFCQRAGLSPTVDWEADAA